MSSSSNDERSTCSICGRGVPTRNLAVHESRCSRRQGEEQVRQPPAALNIRDYNSNYHQETRHSGSGLTSWCFSCGLLGRSLGIVLCFLYGPLLIRLLRCLWEIILLTIRGCQDFSILSYYLRIWKPKPGMIYGQMFGQILHYGGIYILFYAYDIVLSYVMWTANHEQDPLSLLIQHPIFWGAWDMAMLLEYYIGTMKCLRNDGGGFQIGACCSLERRQAFIHLFLDRERPEYKDEEWVALSDDGDDSVRFRPDAWNVANYNYLAWYDFKDIVLGYDKVKWIDEGYVVTEDVYDAIYGAMDDFVSIVESNEWKDEDRHVWFDVVQWNAYYQEQEEDIETGIEESKNKITKKKLAGRIQCWDSVAFYMQTNVPFHPGGENEEGSFYTWEYHPEWSREKCGDAHEWRHQLSRGYPVCMAEVVKAEKDGDTDGRRHTLIIGAAEDNLQCMVDKHQIWYDDCSSSWNSFGSSDLGPVQVAHLMKQYLDGRIHNFNVVGMSRPAYYYYRPEHYAQSTPHEQHFQTNENNENAEGPVSPPQDSDEL